MSAHVGPFDREPWPEKLTANVVEPVTPPRVHGYDIAALVRRTGMLDVVWLALAGELPTPAQRAALDVAAILLAPIHVGEAGCHAALLSRIAGVPPSTTIAIAVVGVGEMVRDERAQLAGWPAQICDAAREPHPNAASTELQRWVDEQMVGWFGAGLPAEPVTRVAIAYAILHHLGLGALAVETLAIWARLPAIAAEAAHVSTGSFRSYPARLPDYQYVDDEGSSP